MPRWLERMSADEIESLPRGSTVVYFPVGVLEDHGPHLPVGLDLDEAEALCRLSAERLEAENAGWVGVIAPRVPVGVEGNTSSWAFSSRGYVLRDYLVDVGWVWLRHGFRYLVCFSGTESVRQAVAIEEAGRILSKKARSARKFLLGFFKSPDAGSPSLVSGRSGNSKPGDLLPAVLGSDPEEHGGKRDTSMALWLYQDTAREPKNLPPDLPRTGSRWTRFVDRFRNRRWGYWGEPSKASADWAHGQVMDEIQGFSARLRAWRDGANPDRVFGSWHALLPIHRTTFKAWLLTAAIFVLAVLYLRSSLPEIP